MRLRGPCYPAYMTPEALEWLKVALEGRNDIYLRELAPIPGTPYEKRAALRKLGWHGHRSRVDILTREWWFTR